MESDPLKRERIIETLNGKSNVKLKCYAKTLEAFGVLKNAMHELAGEVNDELINNRQVKVEYRDKGQFEAQIQFVSDILIFNMHSNVFHFNETHPVWKTEFARLNKYNTYCGVINVYNFLAESFRRNRAEDEGYLIARIFINHDGYFFVEGKGVSEYNYNTFGTRKIDENNLISIVESLMLFAMNFDLLVPPFESVKLADVEQMNTRVENSKIRTGKRLGYNYNVDDIVEND